MSKKISKDNMSVLVKRAFRGCLFEEGDDFSDCIRLPSVTCGRVGISSKRLEQQKKIVTAIMAKLPVELEKEIPFMQLCTTKDGDVWAEDIMVCEQLVIMAVGLNLMSFPSSTEISLSQPGVAPYLFIN